MDSNSGTEILEKIWKQSKKIIDYSFKPNSL